MTARRICALWTVGVAFVASEARAQLAAGFDASASLDGRGDGAGAGADVRFGYRTALTRGSFFHLFIFQPELLAGGTQLPFSKAANGNGQIGFVGGGVRVGLLTGRVEPFAYWHVSYTFGSEDSRSLWDVGASLDWRLPSSSIGVHFGRNWFVQGQGGPPLYELGPHFETRWF